MSRPAQVLYRKRVNALSEILEVSTELNFLWDEPENQSLRIRVIGGWIAPDEKFSVYVGRFGKKLLIGGDNFDYSGKGLTPQECARRIESDFQDYNLSPESLRNGFYAGLEQPLGKYLAKQRIAELRQRRSGPTEN